MVLFALTCRKSIYSEWGWINWLESGRLGSSSFMANSFWKIHDIIALSHCSGMDNQYTQFSLNLHFNVCHEHQDLSNWNEACQSLVELLLPKKAFSYLSSTTSCFRNIHQLLKIWKNFPYIIDSSFVIAWSKNGWEKQSYCLHHSEFSSVCSWN